MENSTGESMSKIDKGFRVAICVPVRDTVDSHFAYDLSRLTGYCGVAMIPNVLSTLNVFFSEGTLIAPQRQDLVERALEANCTHILWLDADMRFPKDTLSRLLAHNKHAVGANYTARRYPHGPTAFASITEEEAPSVKRLYTRKDSKGLQQVPAMGLGVILTQIEVFTRMERPWFVVGYSPRDDGSQGEDIFFGLKMHRETDLQMYVDHDLSREVRHVGRLEYCVEHSEEFEEHLEEQ